MDRVILLSVGISFLVYLVLQILVFRVTSPERAPRWMIKLLLIVEGSTLVIGAMMWGEHDYVTVSIVHASLFMSVSAVYIFTIFSFSEASLTVGILQTIAQSSGKGATYSELKQLYGVKPVIQKRIRWFIAGGEMVKTGSWIRWKKIISFFEMRELASVLYLWLFPRI